MNSKPPLNGERALNETIAYAKKHKTSIITTVEAFYCDPELLYEYLMRAANAGISVHMAPIKTTDRQFDDEH